MDHNSGEHEVFQQKNNCIKRRKREEGVRYLHDLSKKIKP